VKRPPALTTNDTLWQVGTVLISGVVIAHEALKPWPDTGFVVWQSAIALFVLTSWTRRLWWRYRHRDEP